MDHQAVAAEVVVVEEEELVRSRFEIMVPISATLVNSPGIIAPW